MVAVTILLIEIITPPDVTTLNHREMGIKTVTHLCKALSYMHMKGELNTVIRMLWDCSRTQIPR